MTNYKIFSPITILLFVNYFSFSQTITFDNDSGDHKWETASNWSNDQVPGPSNDLLIYGGQSLTIGTNGDFIAQSNTINLVIDVSTIDILKGSSIITEGDLTINSSSTITLNSDSNEFSSLIVNGGASGNITYLSLIHI